MSNTSISKIAAMGGTARASSLTSVQRKAIAQKAAKARWKGHKKKAKK